MISTKPRSVEKRPDGELKNVAWQDSFLFPTIEAFGRFPPCHTKLGNQAMKKFLSLTRRNRLSQGTLEQGREKDFRPLYRPLTIPPLEGGQGGI